MADSEISPQAELRQRLDEIGAAAKRFVGVDSYEHLLDELLEFVQSGRVDRAIAVNEFRRLADKWPWGAVETLEFTMRKLQWSEVRAALEDHKLHGADSRTRTLASHALEVFEPEWPSGEIYRRYR